jgi:hypothetical protein
MNRIELYTHTSLADLLITFRKTIRVLATEGFCIDLSKQNTFYYSEPISSFVQPKFGHLGGEATYKCALLILAALYPRGSYLILVPSIA